MLADASAAVDARSDGQVVAAGLDGEVGLTSFPAETPGVVREQQDGFVGLPTALLEIGVDRLPQFHAFRGDLPGTGFEGLCRFEAVTQSAGARPLRAQGSSART
ncbi:hypothetical protein ACIQZB_38590 [Streptomyces sp. NPDC097727]|uniref:hypothetical protein n=1 Tax=Streptomyces sp. NPDC097727 TaxID=3366092 RepID=UPI003801A426